MLLLIHTLDKSVRSPDDICDIFFKRSFNNAATLARTSHTGTGISRHNLCSPENCGFKPSIARTKMKDIYRCFARVFGVQITPSPVTPYMSLGAACVSSGGVVPMCVWYLVLTYLVSCYDVYQCISLTRVMRDVQDVCVISGSLSHGFLLVQSICTRQAYCGSC